MAMRGGSASSVEATVLTHSDIHAHNTFDHPDAVSALTQKIPASGSPIRYAFAPASVTKLSISLA